MSRCPRCQRGRLWSDDGRLCCLLCSYVASDPVTVMDQVRSNLTNVGPAHQRVADRPKEDLATVLERAQRWGI